MKMISLVLGLLGFIFLLTSIIIFRGDYCSTEGYILTTAKLDTWLPAGGINQVKPFVVFTVDGKEMQRACQLINLKRLQAKPGDIVEVYYRVKKVLGIDGWTVVLKTDENALNRNVRVPRLAAALMLTIGIILLIAAVVIILHTKSFKI